LNRTVTTSERGQKVTLSTPTSDQLAAYARHQWSRTPRLHGAHPFAFFAKGWDYTLFADHARPMITSKSYEPAEPIPHHSRSPRLALGIRDGRSRGIEFRTRTARGEDTILHFASSRADKMLTQSTMPTQRHAIPNPTAASLAEAPWVRDLLRGGLRIVTEFAQRP